MGVLANAMIGAGMLAAPSKVFVLAHGWSFAVLAAAALITTPLIFCFAELGSRFSNTGGPYLYARAALPGWIAFSVGWMLWISQALALATLSNLLVSYLAGFVPVLASGLPRAATIIGLGLAMTVIVLRGVRESAASSNALIVVKAVFVVGFVAAGVWFIQPERLAVVHPPPDPTTLARAVLIYLFAYSGFERAGVIAGEAKDPRRDVPMALLASVALVTVAYATVLLVCVGVLDDPTLTDRPLAEVGALLFGPVGQVAVSAGAIVVILGTIVSGVLVMPRILLGLSEQGQLPAFLARVHPRWRTPHIAILISSVAAFGAALMSDLLSSLTFSTAARIISYVLCCLALWRLSRRADAPPPEFPLPAPGLFAIAAGAIFVGVLAFAATAELPVLAGVLAVGLILYAISRRTAPSPDPRNSP